MYKLKKLSPKQLMVFSHIVELCQSLNLFIEFSVAEEILKVARISAGRKCVEAKMQTLEIGRDAAVTTKASFHVI